MDPPAHPAGDQEGEGRAWYRACRSLPPWPEPLIAGYRTFHMQEAKYTRIAFLELSGAFKPAFRMLTLLDEVLRREHDFAGEGELVGVAWLLRLRLATVAAGTAKVALDAALTGNYVQGFSLVRHLLETWRQMVYVGIRPWEARRWYPGSDGSPPREPKEGTITAALRAHRPVKRLAETVEEVMRALNKAAHPSGQALSQTATGRADHGQLGANYLEPQCLDLMVRLSFATYLLLNEVGRDVPITTIWAEALAEVGDSTGLRWAEYAPQGPAPGQAAP